jgi:BirA family biotin operon repressor/biotin-[acetyl-CoA-carboxylase] ligase
MPALPAATELGVIRLVHYDRVASTMDEAHELAVQGAPAGTCVLADEQTAGRGRSGHEWRSESRRGVWLTLLERPRDSSALDVMSLRLGLAIANGLESLPGATDRYQLKWPNDVFNESGKVAGVLVEARWREQLLEWVAIGVGINLYVPEAVANASSLPGHFTRNDVLRSIVPRLRAASAITGKLTSDELREWYRRDYALDRMLVEPIAGVAAGVSANGALRVALADGSIDEVRSGSLRFA